MPNLPAPAEHNVIAIRQVRKRDGAALPATMRD
jgi:hypothetical protein